jgi:hypothetical protein
MNMAAPSNSNQIMPKTAALALLSGTIYTVS